MLIEKLHHRSLLPMPQRRLTVDGNSNGFGRHVWHRACIVSLILGMTFLQGCSQTDRSRLKHYQNGGSFFGGGPAVSPDGDFVIFASPRTGNGDLYQAKIDGTNLARLTSNEDYECDAHYSPDGSSIVFVREIKSQGDIWIMKSRW